MKKYAISDLHDLDARERAKEQPDAWRAFMCAMRDRYYDNAELANAWLWFLTGWNWDIGMQQAKDAAEMAGSAEQRSGNL